MQDGYLYQPPQPPLQLQQLQLKVYAGLSMSGFMQHEGGAESGVPSSA